MLVRIAVIEPRADYGDGDPARVERASMRCCIDSYGTARPNGNAGAREPIGERVSVDRGFSRRLARADDGDGWTREELAAHAQRIGR